ncbi:hypothetical protein LCGC14_0693750 [marine sediment metagenome]|uniref:Uncharacterized protein n=1 Tax=marine sediment metagenome TaxID=412755 RepID=A0A0F9QPN5_9ZZZZ
MTQLDIQELIEYIKWLGEAAVQRGFELAMLEVQVRIFQHFIWLGVSFVALVVAALLARGALRHEPANIYDNKAFSFWMSAGIVGLVGGVGLFAAVSGLIGYVMNPEWRAIEIIMQAVGG